MTDSFIDTNVLVYAFDRNETIKQPLAKSFFRPVWQGTKSYHISNQILAELTRALTQKINLPYSYPEAQEIIEHFYTRGWILHTYSIKTILSSLRLL